MCLLSKAGTLDLTAVKITIVKFTAVKFKPLAKLLIKSRT